MTEETSNTNDPNLVHYLERSMLMEKAQWYKGQVLKSNLPEASKERIRTAVLDILDTIANAEYDLP